MKTTIDNKYIINIFLQACHIVTFHHHWMTADTWAEQVNNYYMPLVYLCFNEKQLVEAIHQTKWLNKLIESTGAVNEDTCL
jgi:hypothetical protein